MARKRSDRVEDPIAALVAAHISLDRVRRRLQGMEIDLPGGTMSHSRFALLDVLSEHEPVSTKDLAGAAGFSPATISKMIDPMVGQGLVSRTRSQSDRRIVLLSLTPAGQEALEKRLAFWSKRWMAAFEDVDPAQAEIGAEILKRITAVYRDPLSPIQERSSTEVSPDI